MQGEAVLKNVSLELERGKVYGIVGKNGSGKSMLFRGIAGLIRLDSVEIFLYETPLKNVLTQEIKLGLILENINLYMDMSAMENLSYLAQINGEIGKKEIVDVLKRVGLEPQNRKKVKTYSLGMRQKLVIAQAIMEKPDLLLLDEPSNALDEESVNKVRLIVKEEANRGAIVLIASHNQEDIQMLCDEVYFMKNGILTQG